MSRWQEFGFPDQLKFTSPLKAMRGISLAVAERLRPAYPELAGSWYEGNRYNTPLICKSFASAFPVEHGLESNWYNQGYYDRFPLRFPNNALMNPLSTLPRVNGFGGTVHGFWDFSKCADSRKILTEYEFTHQRYIDRYGVSYSEAEDSCHFYSYEEQAIPEIFRFGNVFSERYFLCLYRLINPLSCYLLFRVEEPDPGTYLYCYEAEPIGNLEFSD